MDLEMTIDKEKKIKFMGEGEWVDEPDEICFTYKDYECEVRRVFVREPYSKEEAWFGGYLCGYVRIPKDHPYHHKLYEDMDIDCHYGLTYGMVSNGHWIGFDCGHSSDIVPTLEILKKTSEARKYFEE